MFYSLKTKVGLILGIILLLVGIGFGRTGIKKIETLGVSDTNITSSTTPLPTGTTQAQTLYKVVKVIDGDTLVLAMEGKNETIRLIGIDTPEIVDLRKPVQCFAKEASDKAKEILTGKSVSTESDFSQGDKDKYNRLLRYIFLPDGTNFNLLMIEQGFAHEYTYNLPYKYQKDFKNAEKEAMVKNLGLWSTSTCNGNTSTASLNKASSSPSSQPVQVSNSPAESAPPAYKPSGTYSCDCSKSCSKISTCDEAYYQLQNCGCSARDADGDGVPCETLCR